MPLKKFFCSSNDCNNSEFFSLYVVKKNYIEVICAVCKKKIRIHRSYVPSVFGSKLNGEQIKEVFEYDIDIDY